MISRRLGGSRLRGSRRRSPRGMVQLPRNHCPARLGNPRRFAGRRRAMTITDILGEQLIVITGKGGVGKTTVSLALAFLNARLGRRPVYVTLKEVRPGYPFFGFTGGVGSGETELAPGIRAHYIDPSAALDEYVKERFVRLY